MHRVNRWRKKLVMEAYDCLSDDDFQSSDDDHQVSLPSLPSLSSAITLEPYPPQTRPHPKSATPKLLEAPFDARQDVLFVVKG